MGFWFRVRLGPVGYTARGRRKPQSYRAYKASRERRERYAGRYAAERTAREHEVAPPTVSEPDDALVRGRTDPEFDGLSISDLQTRLTYWQGVAAGTRTPHQDYAHHSVEMAEAEAPKVLAEIDARTREDAPVIEPRFRGLTDTEFNGVGNGTLRAWLKYWKDEERSKHDGGLKTRPRETYISMILAEIDARKSALGSTAT